MFPLAAAPEGTGTTIWLLVQLVGVAVAPLTEMVLCPCEAPKSDPTIVTGVPTAAWVGATEESDAVGAIVKFAGTLDIPFTLTTTGKEPSVYPHP